MLYKFPRTFHLPWSPGGTRDDRRLANCDHFIGKNVVVTTKMDGENTTMYSDAIHARSLSSADHPSRTYVKGLWGSIKHDIPKNWRICGENLFAVHSITYEKLESYFQVFNIWNAENICLSWNDTQEWCELLGLKLVPVLYRGPWSESAVRGSWSPSTGSQDSEGYVVRLEDEFPYNAFAKSIGKFVRASHVQTNSHWMHQKLKVNGLKGSE